MRMWCALACAAIAFGGCAGHPDDVLAGRVNALRPSVVLLTMEIPPEHHKRGPNDEAYATGTIVASGDWGSDVLTVQHAVFDAVKVTVTIGNRRRVAGRVVGMNPDLDVALVRIPARHLPVVALGSSQHVADELGRQVALLGYPVPDEFDDEGLGLDTSLGTGAISSLRKDNIELTMPIVPGESGAAVFLVDTGEVIGVAEARFDDERSIGFALPIDEAKPFLHKIDAGHGL